MNKDSIKELIINTLIMLIITIVAGGILGVVYQVTKEPIAQMEEKKAAEANKAVFVYAASFEEVEVDTNAMNVCLEGQYDNVDITGVLKAIDSNSNPVGFVLEVTSHEGYGGDIVFRIGISNEKIVNGISITSISETAGLGMRAEEVIVPQFDEREAANFEVVKTDAVLDNQIEAISSATITSKAMVNGVNAALLYFDEVLGGGALNE